MPPVVLMQHAADAVRSLLPQAQRSVIGITGPVGAGKSTLAAQLSSCIIATDHYLPDYEHTPVAERDLPERADLTRLLADLRSLRAGQSTFIPQWSFHSHSRVGETEIHPAQIIIVEGLHALHETHAPGIDLRVYVDAPPQIRLDRWEHLALSGQRGWGIDETRSFFHDVAEPTFNTFAHAYRAGAHLIVSNAVQNGA
jgi:uridine kinase